MSTWSSVNQHCDVDDENEMKGVNTMLLWYRFTLRCWVCQRCKQERSDALKTRCRLDADPNCDINDVNRKEDVWCIHDVGQHCDVEDVNGDLIWTYLLDIHMYTYNLYTNDKDTSSNNSRGLHHYKWIGHNVNDVNKRKVIQCIHNVDQHCIVDDVDDLNKREGVQCRHNTVSMFEIIVMLTNSTM